MKKKILSILLTLLMILNMFPVSALANSQVTNFTDMPNNWATEALTEAVKNGLLEGHDGKLYPDKNLTRAEMATVINRAFGAIEKTNIESYTDVKYSDWHYEEMSKAVGMGTFQGYANQLRPNDPITREEVFSVLSNALKLRAEKTNKVFIDSNEVSAWAQESVNGMINGGYISGSNGKLNPKANITRAEFAQVMLNVIKDYVKISTVYEEVNAGNVIVNTPNATLKNVTIKGDLIIAEGVGEGEVTLDNVKVEGRMLVRAGGENSIIIKGDSEIETIVIVKQGNKVRIFNETGKEIAVATVEGTADVILEGKFKNVVVQSPNITVYAQDTKIENVEINGTRSKVIVDYKSEIEKVVVRAANVVIEGKGTVEEVEVKAGGSGTEITTPETQIDVDRGANNVVGTGGVEIEPNETYVNGKTDSQDAKPLVKPSTGGSSGGGTVTTYTVNYSVVGSNGALTGTVASGNSVNSGTSVTFTATPSDGYEIREWKVNGVAVESGTTLTRTISANTTVTVEFKEIVVEPTMYTVTYSVIGEGGTLIASVPNGGTAQEGSSVNFTATPDEGYRLKEWRVNGEVLDWLTGLHVSRDMISDVDFKVEFELINPAPTTYSLTYSVVGEGGTLSTSYSSGASIPINAVILMTATPDEGYRVKEWTFNSQPIVSTNTVYSFTMTRNNIVTVEFEEIPATMYTVNFSRVGSVGNLYAHVEGIGHIYDGNQVAEGTDVTFTADIPSGYEIKEWRYNGNLVEPEGNNLTISNIGMDIDVTIEFSAIPIYELSIYVGNVTAPTVTVKDSLNNNRPVVETIPGGIFVYNLEAGSYTATIEKDGYYTETRNFTVPETNYVEVYMEEVLPGIVSVNNPPIIELNVGQDLPTLPSTVDVVLDTDAVVTLNVIWNTDGFDKNSPENYVLGGTLTLIDGVENPRGLVALQLVDVFAAPEVTLEITNSNILRFNFDVPAVWVGETELTDINTIYILRELFNDPTLDYTVLNESNIVKNVGPGYMEIELRENAINRDLFWELDHPGGYYEGNGDGIYRKDVSADLSIFNNHLGLASESTVEPFKLKFAANYNEYGLPDYDDVISGVWQTAEQRAAEIDTVRTMPTYEAFFTDTNVLRIESNQPIYYLDGPMWAEVDKAMLLADLFGHGEDFRDVEELFDVDKVGITMEDTAFEIQLFSGVFDSDFFWNIDHPDGIDPGYDINPYPLDKDGNGVYRRLNTLDLSIFYNSSWDYVEETVDYYLKLYVPFENGIGKYSEPVQAVWQSVDQRNADIVNDIEMDTTAPMFVSITTTPETSVGTLIEEPGEYDIWVDEGEILRFEITTNDNNIYRFSPFSNLEERTWYYALPDVYNGDEVTRTQDIDAGVTVTYANGTWYLDLGADISSGSNIVRFMDMDFEDYAGNKWSDIEGDTLNRTILFHLSRLDIVALNELKETVEGFDPLDYTPSSWSEFEEAINIAMGMPETTQEEVDDKVAAINIAIDILAPYIEVTQVEIDEIYDTIIVGERYNLTTTVLPVDATNKNIIWSIVEGPGQIDHTGELIANDEGVIVVRATSESYFMVWDELAFTGVLTPSNEPPVPYEDTVIVNSGSTTLIDVIAFSTDAEDDTLSIVGFEQGINGTVTQEGDSLRYTPIIDFIGTDSFMYEITDGTNNVSGEMQITVNPSGVVVGTGYYDSYEIKFYRKTTGELTAVLANQTSTEELLIAPAYTSILGIEEFSDKIVLIYANGNVVYALELFANGTNVDDGFKCFITSNGGGTISSIQYVVDSTGIIHFIYFDSEGQADQYSQRDLMYYNTMEVTKEVLHYGYRENMGGSDYINSYVSEITPVITIDNGDNVVVMYVYRDWSTWSGGQDHTYYLKLIKPDTGQKITLESYYVSRALMNFSGLELIGGGDITVKYTYNGVNYERIFNGSDLTEQ
ncbi:InlB B-repeat-containing protein [Sedimentibacter saalensis]|uniref:InlB B-repeat-containing protein n=1 Tax=Sedimentibacter saalensis TaxID=130788 RepID=UPI00289F25A3|nr:S-layer homology domain-containing protein [Sedimentibacter saalensis]